MSKKSSAPQETTSTVTQTNLPAYVQPYFERILADAEAQSNQPYVAYGGPRIAGFSDATNAAFGGVQDMASRGDPYGIQGGLGSVAGSNAMLSNPNLGTYENQQVGTDQWNNQIASQYMNPFVNQVLGNQQQAAFKRYNEGRGGRNEQAIRAGAFGGSRQGINEYMAERDMQSELASSEAQAYRDAYQSGLGAYQTDAARQLQAATANQGAGIQAADLRQRGILGAAGQAAQNAGIYGQLASTQQGLEMDRLNALRDVGYAQQDQSQKSLDLAYQDFVNQRDYGRQNINFMSGILHGVPVQANSEVSTYQAPPSPLSQAAGLGTLAASFGMGGGK